MLTMISAVNPQNGIVSYERDEQGFTEDKTRQDKTR